MDSLLDIKADIQTLESKIELEKANLRQTEKETRILRRRRRREKYLYGELVKIQKGATYLRAIQASINIRKMYPDKLKRLQNQARRIRATIGGLIRNKEISEEYLRYKILGNEKGLPLTRKLYSRAEATEKLKDLDLWTLEEFKSHMSQIHGKVLVGFFRA